MPSGSGWSESGGAFAVDGCQRIRERRRRDGFSLLLPYCYERGTLDQETAAGCAESLAMSSRIKDLVVGRVGIEPTTKRLRADSDRCALLPWATLRHHNSLIYNGTVYPQMRCGAPDFP